jgi:hypothetical protein
MSCWIRQLIPIEQWISRRRDASGFVLLSVLSVIGIVSALMIALTMAVRADRSAAAIEWRIVQASALSDAGLSRIIAALEAPDDPFYPVSSNRFDGVLPTRR